MSNIVRSICIAKEQLTGILPKFFPNVVEPQHAYLQLLELKTELEGLPTQLETNFNSLQMIMNRNREYFLDMIGFAFCEEPSTITLLQEVPVMSLQFLLSVQNKSQSFNELVQSVCSQACSIVGRFQNQLQQIDPVCLEIYLRRITKDEYRVIIGLKEQLLRLSMKRSYEEGQYAELFTSNLRNRTNLPVRPSSIEDEALKGISVLQDFVQKYLLEQQKSKLESTPELFELLQTFSFDQARGLFALAKHHLESGFRIYNKVVQEKQTMINKGFDWQLLSFDDVTSGKPTEGSLYNNPLCSHFDSFSKESIQRTYDKCRKCGQQIIADPTKLYLYENKFLAVLKNNFLNPRQEKVLYSFKSNVFFVGKPFNFYNYSHFAEYIRSTKAVLDRPEMPLLLDNEKAYLSIRLFQASDYLTDSEAVVTPVRGIFCKHIGFFDLSRIYTDFVKGGSRLENLFECPICDCEMPFNDLVFLPEIVNIMSYILNRNFIGKEKTLVYLSLCHSKKELKVVVKKPKKLQETVLPFYANLLDPRLKLVDKDYQEQYHSKLVEEYNQHRIQPQPQDHES